MADHVRDSPMMVRTIIFFTSDGSEDRQAYGAEIFTGGIHALAEAEFGFF